MKAGQISVLFGWVLACACGGAAAGPEPATADTKEPAKEAPAEEPADKPEAEPAAEKPAADKPAAEAPDAPLTDKEIAAALQSLFGDPQLIDYLHLKLPGRSPLKVHGEKLPAKLEVIVGSHHVKVVPQPGSKKDAVMVFTKIEREGGQIKLHYRYDIEGIDGRATLSFKEGHWELTANRLVEK